MNFKEKLFAFYQINEEDYKALTLEPSLASLYLNHEFNSGKEVAHIIKDLILKKKKIIIYGDYDADGIMGTSILVMMFKKLNYDVDCFIPNRYLDGYGINEIKANEIILKGYDAIITVDNGISAFKPIELLKNHGLTVLVLDHHEVQEGKLPNADAIMHPFISSYGNIATSGAFVALMCSYYVLNIFDKYLLTLAAISLITDMMPLKEYNRDLIRYVTKNYIRDEKENFAINNLLEDKPFDYNSIGRYIGPKINAIGRMITNNTNGEIVKYFTSDDKDFILYYYSFINETNETRKNLTLEANKNIAIKPNDKCVVRISEAPEGLIGLIAGNITNKYHIPSVILNLDKSGNYKASARSPLGFNIFEAFQNIDISYVSFGGHAQAAGFSLRKDDFEKFKINFVKYCENHPQNISKEDTIEIEINDINNENISLLESLSPFGEQWKEPKFKIKHLKTDLFAFVGQKENVCRLKIGYNTLITGFNVDKSKFKEMRYIDIIGSLSFNVFAGYKNCQFVISSFSKSLI